MPSGLACGACAMHLQWQAPLESQPALQESLLVWAGSRRIILRTMLERMAAVGWLAALLLIAGASAQMRHLLQPGGGALRCLASLSHTCVMPAWD